MKKLYLTIVSLVLLTAFAYAQTPTVTTLPYQLGFEESEASEISKWVLNPGAEGAEFKKANKWMVGTSIRATGRRSLYITYDGETATMGKATPSVQYAYRDYLLPQGTYNISFDWICLGDTSLGVRAEMYAGQVGTTVPLTASTGATDLPMAVKAGLKVGTGSAYAEKERPDGGKRMAGARTWQSAGFQVQSNGTRVTRIFFAWRNNVTATGADTLKAVNMAAVVDNIQITSASSLKPMNLTVDVMSCDSVLVQWEGYSEEYIVEYRATGKNTWTSNGVQPSMGVKNYAWLKIDSDGSYDFRVHGVVYDENRTPMPSAYLYMNDYSVFCPENHCINYVNLKGSQVECTIGSGASGYQQVRGQTFMPAVMDFGPESQESRHTVIWDRTATDPRTGGRLKLIPEGEFATVRLGNWKNGNEYETIEYNYLVDSASAILLLKYAVVEEDPGHSPDHQPRFVLDILDESGTPIDVTCGHKDFYSGDPNEHWNSTGSVKWKDWTTMGLDLRQYAGEVIHIRFSNFDCFETGHYGYAYFVLGCAAATIDVDNCGTSDVIATAPDGFDYKWFLKADSTAVEYDPSKILSTQREFHPGSSDEYTCRMTYKSMSQCSFELHTVIYPRYPLSVFEYQYVPANCENKVTFTNNSHVQTPNEDGSMRDLYNEKLDEYDWWITGPNGWAYDSHEAEPVVVFPQTGGEFQVSLLGYLSDRKCEDDTTIVITIPAIGDVEQHERDTLCFGDIYTWHNKMYAETGDYTDSLQTIAGCDSVVTLHLYVFDDPTTRLDTVQICYGEPYSEGGDTYPYQSSHYWRRVKQTVFGCDSIVYQQVNVAEEINPSFEVTQMDENHETASIVVSGDGYSYYIVNGNTEDKNPDLSHIADAGTYTLTFYNDYACEQEHVIEIQPGCVKNIVYQRWDDVLSLKNMDNGGLEYQSYQWYKNDEKLEGETRSYIYVAEGMQTDDFYTVALVLADGTEVTTCPFHPKAYSGSIEVTPLQVAAGGQVQVKSAKRFVATCYNVMGQAVYSLAAHNEGIMTMRGESGVYLIVVESEDGVKQFRVHVGL